MLLIKLFLIPIAFACCESNVWNGITPFKSTIAEVEKILGEPLPESSSKHEAVFKTEKEKVWVSYTVGTCRSEPDDGRVVPEMTVSRIKVIPNVRPKLPDLNLDEREFERVDDSGRVYFHSKKVGIRVAVNTSDMRVEHILYLPKGSLMVCTGS
jgi:hypothetical protein